MNKEKKPELLWSPTPHLRWVKQTNKEGEVKHVLEQAHLASDSSTKWRRVEVMEEEKKE